MEAKEKTAKTAGGFRHLVAATRNSLRGVRDALGATAFRQECAVGLLHYAALCVVPMRFSFRLALAMAWALVLSAELMNTALEAVVDLVSPEWNPLARQAKDCASAAVFVLLALTACLWCAALALS